MKAPREHRGIQICASLMCADLTHLSDDVAVLDGGGVDYIHFDIMDGHFVPNFTLGPDVMRAVRKITDMPFDVHMMLHNPDPHLERFVDAGATLISVHAEATNHLPRTLERIRALGASPAIALNPATPLSALDYTLEMAEMILVMTVNPGFAGQTLVPQTLGKIADLRRRIDACGRDIALQVDGNVSFENIPRMVDAGATMLVCGTSSLFRPGAPLEDSLKKLQGSLAELQRRPS